MDMHNPAHPGELLSGWLDELGVSVPGFADHIGISRVMLSRVLNARSTEDYRPMPKGVGALVNVARVGLCRRIG